MDPETVFEEEAQEEALLSRSRTVDHEDNSQTWLAQHGIQQAVVEDESSPLISDARKTPRQSYHRATNSYARALNEPWTGAKEFVGRPWYKRPSIYWLLPAFLPFTIGFGGILVPKTYLVLDLICQDYLSDRSMKDPTFHFMPVIFGSENPQCRDPHVQSLVAKFQLYSSLLSGIFSALVSPYLGALSDRIGRKPIMVYSSLGLFFAEIITIIVGTHAGQISVYWILLGSFLDGICGSFTAGMACAFAYATDTSPPERRSVAMGYFHGVLFLGIAIGPIFAGYLIERSGNIMIAFYVVIACHAFFMLFVTLVVPESLSNERQQFARKKYDLSMTEVRKQKWTTTLRNYNFFAPLKVLSPRGPGTSTKLRRNLFLLAAIDTLMFGVAMGTMQIVIIYAQFRHDFSVVDSSKYLTAANLCRVVALVVLLPFLTRIFRRHQAGNADALRGSDRLDINLIRVALFFDFLGYMGYAFVPTGALFVLSGMIAALGGMGSPTLQSSLTKSVPADRTGQMLGASGLLHALARVVSPTIFNLIYSATVDKFVGTVFVCLASCFVIATIMSWFLKPHGKSFLLSIYSSGSMCFGTNSWHSILG